MHRYDARMQAADTALPRGTEPSGYVHHGTAAFTRINLALFAAGFATFGLL